jgi:hypothetical protein
VVSAAPISVVNMTGFRIIVSGFMSFTACAVADTASSRESNTVAGWLRSAGVDDAMVF